MSKKTEKAIAEANRIAGLLAAAPYGGNGPLSPPAFINDPLLAPALAVWNELEPLLRGTQRLKPADRHTFAALCYWHGEYVTALADIAAKGYSYMVKATAGGKRPWVNPSVQRRDTAWLQVMELSKRFGLTPLDRVAFNKARLSGHDDDAELPLPHPSSAGTPAPTPETEKPPSKWHGLLPN